MITIKIKTDNAAFVDNWHGEVARILKRLSKDIEGGGSVGPLYDMNGNKVGELIIESEGRDES